MSLSRFIISIIYLSIYHLSLLGYGGIKQRYSKVVVKAIYDKSINE